jgi:hypothetical protein
MNGLKFLDCVEHSLALLGLPFGFFGAGVSEDNNGYHNGKHRNYPHAHRNENN